MPCYKPIKAARLSDGTISFKAKSGEGDSLDLACGRCIGCRIDRSRNWAIRCMNEASEFEDNSFITLTYADEYLPKYGSLKYSDFQLFMKRLRKRFTGKKIRFYMCGEYGEENLRPHYHAILFNLDFKDKKAFFKSKSGSLVYRSEELEKLWTLGQSSIGDVTEQSAGYVARYCMKKIIGRGQDINPETGKRFDSVYDRLDIETGEIVKVVPEFTKMSLRSGIGKNWLTRYYKDVYPNDAIVSAGGLKMKPPKYYDKLFEQIDPDEMEYVKQQRIMRALNNYKEASYDRLAVKEEIQAAKLKKLVRTL